MFLDWFLNPGQFSFNKSLLAEIISVFPEVKEKKFSKKTTPFASLSFHQLHAHTDLFKKKDPYHFYYSPRNKDYFPQILTKIKREDEKKLLKKSLQSFFKKEMTQITLYTQYGFTYRSKVYKGGIKTGLSLKMIKNFIDQKSFNLRRNGDEIIHIELNHTHPFHDLVSNEKGIFILHALSLEDLNLAKRVSLFTHFPITVRAITASELIYSSSFFAGSWCDLNFV